MTALVFHALGDPTRLLLVERLSAQGALSLGRLIEGLPMSRQAASKHVHVLRAAGLVSVQEQGRETVCALDTSLLREAERWIEARAVDWDNRLAKLKTLVDGEF